MLHRLNQSGANYAFYKVMIERKQDNKLRLHFRDTQNLLKKILSTTFKKKVKNGSKFNCRLLSAYNKRKFKTYNKRLNLKQNLKIFFSTV